MTTPRGDLSLWQSAVTQVVYRELLSKNPALKYNSPEVRQHPRVLGAHLMVQAMERQEKVPSPDRSEFASATPSAQSNNPHHHSYLSQQYFNHAKRMIDSAGTYQGNPVVNVSLPFSDSDLSQWAYSALEYTLYHPLTNSSQTNTANQTYNDYTIQGGGDLNYGVIEYVLPAGAQVVILGDFGTGQPDAVAMLTQMLTQLQPDCILHLGDVYYAGMEIECQCYFVDVFQQAFAAYGQTVPVFSIPGNHEYMGGMQELGSNGLPVYAGSLSLPVPTGTASGGSAFYQVVLPLNGLTPLSSTVTPIPDGCDQEASYFCLRTADNSWQFLAMDTGFYSVPTAGPTLGPPLHATEVAWLQDKLNNFSGNTIMLSHHQLFSANASINGSTQPGSDYLNDFLITYFQPYFSNPNGSSIRAWFWGHEHAYGIFEDGLYGLPMGRLVGCSGYEEEQTPNLIQSNPYAQPVASPLVNYGTGMTLPGYDTLTWPYPEISTSSTLNWYNHVFACIDFTAPSAPVVSYYQFPAWAQNSSVPASPAISPLTSETIPVTNSSFVGWTTPLPGIGPNAITNMVTDGTYIYLSCNGAILSINLQGQIQNGSGLSLSDASGEEVRMVLANGNLYACSMNGYVYCISTGSNPGLIWQSAQLSYRNTTNIAVNNLYVYAGYDGNVATLSLADGSVVDQDGKSHKAISSAYYEVRLAVSGEYLYAGTNGDLYVLLASDLSSVNENSISGALGPVVNIQVAGDYVYAGSNGSVGIYNLDGSTISGYSDSLSLPGTGFQEVRLATDGVNVYFGTGGYTGGFTIGTLDFIWSQNPVLDFSGSFGITNVAASNGNLYAGCYGNLFLVDVGTGAQGPKLDIPFVAGDTNMVVPILLLSSESICGCFSGNVVIDEPNPDGDNSMGYYSNQNFLMNVSQVTLT